MMASYEGQRAIGRLSGFAKSILKTIVPASRRYPSSEVVGLRSAVEEKTAIIKEQTAALDHMTKIFDRASVAANLGVWQCVLPENSLEWTDMVYDIFDMPRGSDLDRDQIVKLYAPASLLELETLRSAAIAELGGFSFDAEITTGKGRRRWIRITATVESDAGSAVRIFGIKQDITDEKLMWDRIRYLATCDVMTGLANRSEFQAKLLEIGACETPAAQGTALLLIDLDGFKALNDTFGHLAGDDCLRETAHRLRRIFAEASLIARIGGDEFAVFIDHERDREKVLQLGQSIVDTLQSPFVLDTVDLKIGASVGIAFARDTTPQDLFKDADAALYAAKAAGRNQFKVFEKGIHQAHRRPRNAA